MSKRNKKHNPISFTDTLINKLKKEDIFIYSFLELLLNNEDCIFQDPSLELELLISNGLPIDIKDNLVMLKTKKNKIKEQTFCVVDIETTGGDITRGKIIELGAVKFRNGEIIETYDSLIYSKDIPAYVQEITNITPEMLENAPKLQDVLEEFKLFLEDDVFVAHDIKFDYKFISDSLEKYNLGKLQNRSLCTIDLAKRTILAQRYGLDFLKDLLNINKHEQHRALNDALSTTDILKRCLEELPEDILTTEELIDFSKSNNILTFKLEEGSYDKENIDNSRI